MHSPQIKKNSFKKYQYLITLCIMTQETNEKERILHCRIDKMVRNHGGAKSRNGEAPQVPGVIASIRG